MLTSGGDSGGWVRGWTGEINDEVLEWNLGGLVRRMSQIVYCLAGLGYCPAPLLQGESGTALLSGYLALLFSVLTEMTTCWPPSPSLACWFRFSRRCHCPDMPDIVLARSASSHLIHGRHRPYNLVTPPSRRHMLHERDKTKDPAAGHVWSPDHLVSGRPAVGPRTCGFLLVHEIRHEVDRRSSRSVTTFFF